jgi:hypothetical protein
MPSGLARKRYNVRVVAPTKSSDAHKQHRKATYASEAAGLLLVAFLLLALTIIRYWHNIHWSWR